MGKFLLSLMCLLAVGFTTNAETIEITPKDLGRSENKYVNTAFDFTKDGVTFTINNVNPTSGQVQANKAAASAFYLFNKTAIENITNVEIVFSSVGANTPNNAYIAVGSNPFSSVINSSAVNGTWDKGTQTASWDCIDISDKYFRINFNTKINGTVKFTKIIITYENSTEPIEPPFSINPETTDVTIGETVSFPNITPSSLKYTFTTTDNSIIELDSDNKTIKALAIGTATVNFTTEAVDGKYLAGSGSFTVNVIGKEPKMSFANSSVYGKLGTGVVWQQVNITEPSADYGTISYSSSNPDIVSVDPTTGQIKPTDVKQAGSATITATMAAKDDYAEGKAEYLIVVIDPNANVEPGTTVFDFTTTNPYGMTTMSGNTTSYEKDMDNPVTSIAGVNETVIISFDGRYRSWKTSNSNELRVEKSNTTNPASSLTVKVPEGYKITKIGITGSAVTPKYSPESGDSPDDDFNSVWIPTVIDGSSQVVDEVTITADPNQLKISKINVMWDASGSDVKPAQLTFAPNVNGIYVNEEAEINAVNNPEGRTITYSIAGLNADQYTITPSEDGKTMKVLVNTPGTYTLEARSAAGDGFRDGFAIMRLNVYRHLAVYVADEEIEQDEINTETKTYIRIDVPENAFLYYKFENSSTPETTADDITDENLLPGYTLYDNGDDIPIPAKTIGYFNFYIANYGYKSPIRKIALSFETGVTDIDANTEDGVVRLFDLNGRQINGEPEKGVYIRIQNGKASKVLVK